MTSKKRTRFYKIGKYFSNNFDFDNNLLVSNQEKKAKCCFDFDISEDHTVVSVNDIIFPRLQRNFVKLISVLKLLGKRVNYCYVV